MSENLSTSSWRDPAVLARLLLYGDPVTRRSVADAVAEGDLDLATLLTDTARSDENVDLRARCIEVLGLALAGARTAAMRETVASLVGPALLDKISVVPPERA